MSVTRANVAVLKTEDGRITAGVELCRRGEAGFIPYHVISWAGELKTPTVRQALPAILTDALDVADPSHELVIFRSFNRGFMKGKSLAEAVAMGRRIKVSVQYDTRRSKDAMLLAEDALRRGYTISVPV